MHDCRVHAFSKREDPAWFDTVGALHGAFPGDVVQVFFDIGEFMKVSCEQSGALVVILAPRDPAELDTLCRMRECIWKRDVLMILTNGEVPQDLSGEFRPRVVLSEPLDMDTVVETVKRMASREADRHRSWQREVS